MTKDKICSTPRCRGIVEMIYLGKGICEKCWIAKCKEGKKITDLPVTDWTEIVEDKQNEGED